MFDQAVRRNRRLPSQPYNNFQQWGTTETTYSTSHLPHFTSHVHFPKFRLGSSSTRMDAVVQLIRNALCCCKDLSVFEGTVLHDAATTRRFIGGILPGPMDKTTPLEFLIFITQLYACVSCTRSGYSLLTTSTGKLRRILRMVQLRLYSPSTDWSQADRIVNESLLKEAKFALRSAFIGFLVFPLGIAFFWLTANSLHVTETNWIGGLPALIYALVVMEIALVPLLYFMIVDGFEMLAKSRRCKDLLDIIDSGNLTQEAIGIHRYESMTDWVPFWDAGVPMFAPPDQDEAKKMHEEVQKVKDTLLTWFPEGKTKGEKEDKLSRQAFETAKDRLESAVPQLQLEGYREFLYFLFNFVAFYGYLMGPLAYYYEDEKLQPFHVRSLKLFYDNEYADWAGNFAGDLMWTIEPVVIIGSPFLVEMMKGQKARKVKSD